MVDHLGNSGGYQIVDAISDSLCSQAYERISEIEREELNYFAGSTYSFECDASPEGLFIEVYGSGYDSIAGIKLSRDDSGKTILSIDCDEELLSESDIEALLQDFINAEARNSYDGFEDDRGRFAQSIEPRVKNDPEADEKTVRGVRRRIERAGNGDDESN